MAKNKPRKATIRAMSCNAATLIKDYVATLRTISPKDLAEISSAIQSVSSKMFPPRDYSDLIPVTVPQPPKHPYRLPEGVSPRMEKIDAQMMTLRDLLAVAVSAKQLGDEWNFVVQYCLKLADEIVPDEHTPEETK